MNISILLSAAVAFVLLVAGCSDSKMSEPANRGGETAMPSMPGGEEAGMSDDQSAEISVTGDTVSFKGEINPESYQKFFSAVQGKEGEIKTIVVTSGGGDIGPGMQIGAWLFDNNVDVVVDTLCFSSCGNYIFTAARNKTIRAGAVVGWHGSAQQDALRAARMGKTVDQLVREEAVMIVRDSGGEVTESRIRQEVESLKKQNAADIAMEQEFLKKIGVPVDALIYGFTESQYAAYSSSKAQGWTFSIEDMAKLGIRNVTYQGQGSYPDPAEDVRSLATVLKVE